MAQSVDGEQILYTPRHDPNRMGPTGVARRTEPSVRLVDGTVSVVDGKLQVVGGKEWTCPAATDISKTLIAHGHTPPAQDVSTLTPERKLDRITQLLTQLDSKLGLFGAYHRIPTHALLQIQAELKELLPGYEPTATDNPFSPPQALLPYKGVAGVTKI